MTPTDESGVLARARIALDTAGLSSETLQDRLRADFAPWRQKIVDALGGARRFTSLTLAIFAEVTDADITWLLTGAPADPISVCVIDESVGAGSTVTR